LPPMRSVTNGVGINFDVIGPADGRPVILLHGFPEDRHCWDTVAGALTGQGYRVLAPDQRGYSPAARPRGRRAYAIGELTADVMALADAAGAEHFDVVGHDWGGGVAWDVAARHPDRVRTLTVLSTPHPRAFLASMRSSTQLLHSWYMLFFQIPRVPEMAFASGGGKRMKRSLTRSGLDAATADRYTARFADPDAMTGPVNWYRGLPFGSRAPTPPVRVPTLYVWSDHDGFLTRRSAELTARFVEGPYRFEVLEGETHWLPTSAGEKISDLLLQHLAAHDS